MKKIKIKSPATVANLSCGYDILGLCLNEPFDYIEIEKITSSKVEIDILPSCFSDIPSNPELNTGGVPAIQIIKDLKLDFGFNIKIKKGIPLCGGLGSSAATAAGVVYGINKILNDALSFEQMIQYALEGEKLSSDSPHADNIAPCILGGLVLVKETCPIDVVRLPIGPFYLALLHPNIIVNTKYARKILPEKIPLKDAVKQWGNISALTYAFSTNNINLISTSMKDCIIEPVRSKLIDGFSSIKKSALDAGAMGSSISGSGPTIFALCKSKDSALDVKSSMEKAAKLNNLQYNSYISPINYSGPQVVE
tara:strand:- start:803 stop:1729 length:927 start_codon:yes stop_codon:yes gene_type:complete